MGKSTDMVEGVELPCAIDAGGFHDLHGQTGIQILLHKEEHRRGRNAGMMRGMKLFFSPIFVMSCRKPSAETWVGMVIMSRMMVNAAFLNLKS